MYKFFNRFIKVSQIPAITVAVLLVINGLIDVGVGLLYLLDLKSISDFFLRFPTFLELEPIAQTNTILTIFFGLLLMTVGVSLYRRRRSAWIVAILVLSAQFINNAFLEFKPILCILTGLSLIILLFSQRLFYIKNKKLNYSQVIAWMSIIFALSYGIIGTYLLRNQFQDLHTLIDSIYYTIVTFSTVGYGDIVPLTQNAKFFVATMIVVGLGAFAIAISALVVPLIEREIKGVFYIMNRMSNLNNHIVICGYNEIAIQTILKLNEKKLKYVLIEANKDLAKQAEDHGFHVINGKSDSINSLKQANVLAAKTILCLEKYDAENILIALTLNDYFLKEDISRPTIIAKMEESENIQKAKMVGIDHVFSPATLSSLFVVDQLTL